MPDQEIPRWGLTYEEYTAYLELCALVGTIGNLSKKLEKRLRKIPGAWRDARLLDVKSANLITSLCDTIPAKKLLALRREIDHTEVYIRTRPDYCQKSLDNITYVREDALDALVQHVMNMDCYLCMKNHAESKQCEIRKTIENLYHFDVDVKKKEGCPLAGLTFVRNEEENV